jgi:hypothetical protein
VRPTDEDQPGSRRPNLMSSTRRSANEINILAMLDRQASGALPRRMLRRFLSRPAMMWYGAAGLLVCGVVGALAWLARDSTPASADTALAGSIKPAAQAPAAIETVGNAPLVASTAEPAPAADPEPPARASIVDVAPAPEPAAPALAVRAPVSVPAHALPQQQAAGRIAVHEAQRDPARLAAQTAAAKTGPRTVHAGAPVHAGPPAARSRRQAAAAKAPAAPSAVDTDVALISAIIQHANAREEAQKGCADKGCGARKP